MTLDGVVQAARRARRGPRGRLRARPGWQAPVSDARLGRRGCTRSSRPRRRLPARPPDVRHLRVPSAASSADDPFAAADRRSAPVRRLARRSGRPTGPARPSSTATSRSRSPSVARARGPRHRRSSACTATSSDAATPATAPRHRRRTRERTAAASPEYVHAVVDAARRTAPAAAAAEQRRSLGRVARDGWRIRRREATTLPATCASTRVRRRTMPGRCRARQRTSGSSSAYLPTPSASPSG